MPSCSLYVSLDAVVPTMSSTPVAPFSIRIPDEAPLLGVEFFLQAFVPDPNANALGLVASNGLACRVGT